ncbi:ThiJ/PfpI family protein [Thozetella sp. PMI_491]|nr:ThiJ/PfpI family protein [Thozetella sp. PMI_491]
MSKPQSKRKPVRIGVFLPGPSQLLDLACIDVFGSMSHEYLSGLEMLPAAVTDAAPPVTISYIGTVEPGAQQLVELTSNLHVATTHHLSDPDVGPGKLDIVLVPGVDPVATFGKDVTSWLADQAAHPDTDILCVCTGIFLCGEAGLLKGRRVCGPRGLQNQLRVKFEGATWLGEELRWVQDGNFWSSGGITNGNDLVAAYAKQSRHFPTAIAELGAQLTDVGDRPQKYQVGQTRFTLGFVWILIKAFFTPKGATQ